MRENIFEKLYQQGVERRKNSENSYANSKNYTKKDDWYRRNNSGNTYYSRLGDLGLEASGDGTYKLYDKDGKLIDQCAQTVNALQQMLGKHQNTTGNAWTSQGMFGEDVLFNGYRYLPKIGNYNKVSHTIQNMLASAATQLNLNNIDLQTGDVVGLYSYNSAHNDEAWNQGTNNRSNSHEGIVFRPFGDKRKDKTYIIHNINGKVYVDPISKFMVSEQGISNLNWAPTYVMRPKQRPETESQEIYPTSYRENINGKIYDILNVEGMKKYGLDFHSGTKYYLENGVPKKVN